ncbi:MAG: four helix bundle protein [Deltaproteobacteria bacterium HGW-Deltaproteobacteria-21]|nr:MAG: four helix bundle protein [Deltaproteobacteria bacterium HGW-Deltaproteobacteria-21]
MKITCFEDLECWKEARNLVKLVYAATRDGHFRRDLRLSGQIQAAATSAMANCAEGFIRHSDKEFTQFLFIAMSSAAEVQSHLYVALDQDYIDESSFRTIYDQAEKTAMIISGLIKYLRSKQTNRPMRTEQTKQTK